MAKHGNKERVNVTLDSDVMEELKGWADVLGLPMSTMVSVACSWVVRSGSSSEVFSLETSKTLRERGHTKSEVKRILKK